MHILILLAVISQASQDAVLWPSFQASVAWPSFRVTVESPDPQPAEPAVRLLAFTSTWCGPCARMKPVLAALEAEGLEVQHINFDREKTLVSTYGVTTLPTTIVLRNGREVTRRVGIVAVDTLRTLARIVPGEAKPLVIVRPKATHADHINDPQKYGGGRSRALPRIFGRRR